MGIEGISPFRLLIILAIVLVLFGGRRLRDLGGDLGGAIRGFKDAMKDGESGPPHASLTDAGPGTEKAAGASGRENPDG